MDEIVHISEIGMDEASFKKRTRNHKDWAVLAQFTNSISIQKNHIALDEWKDKGREEGNLRLWYFVCWYLNQMSNAANKCKYNISNSELDWASLYNELISSYTVTYQHQIQRWKLDKDVKDAPALWHFVAQILFLIPILSSSKKQDKGQLLYS